MSYPKAGLKTALIIISICISTALSAQDFSELGSKRVKYFSAEDYNGHAQNWSVFQDKQGMLYFANNDGILLYNGQSWNTVGAFPVRCFSQGDGKRVYAGGDNEFGYIDQNKSGKLQWTSYSKKLPEEYKNFLSVLSIQQSGDKTIFFGFRAILIYQKDSLIKVIKPQTDFRFSFKYKNRIFIRQTDVGLMEFKNNNIYKLPHGEFFSDKPVYMFEPFDENNAILATKLNGLYLVNINNINRKDLPLDSIYKPFKTEADNFFETNGIYHGTILDNDNIALGSTVAGIVIINKKGQIKRVFNKQNGLPVNNVNYVFFDREKNIWLALNNGIANIEMNSPMNFFGEETGYQGIVVGAINFKGKFYVGTLEGLYVLTHNTDFTKNGNSFYKFKRLTQEYNSFMQLDTIDGKLYAATRYGFFEIDNETIKPIRKMEFSYAILHSKTDPSIIFVNNSEGLAIFKKNKNELKFHEQIKGIEHEVRYMYEEKDGSLWINGNNNDLLKLNFNNNDYKHPTITTYDSAKGLPSNASLVILKESDHLCVLLPGQGYYRYSSSKSPVGKQDYFYPDPLFPIKFSETKDSISYYLATRFNDTVWYALTAQQGLIKIIRNNSESPKLSLISSSLGRANVTFFLYPDKEHNLLWYSTNKGLFSYKLQNNVEENIPFVTIISEILIGKDSTIYITNDSINKTEIPFTKNSLTINFASLFYQGSENNAFKYYLEGLDSTWADWTKEKYITYNFLPEGNYVFHIKGKNMHGVESSEVLFHFTILPPWYRSWWAYLIYVVIAFLLIIVTAILYGKRLKSSNLKLEEIVNSRTAEIKRQSSEIEIKNLQLNEINKELEKLSIVASETDNTVIIMDKDTNFLWINDSLRKKYNIDYEEFEAIKGKSLLDSSYNSNIKRIVSKCISEKKTILYESEAKLKSGKTIWMQSTLTPILNEEGEIKNLVVIDSDITKMKKAEEKIKLQSEELENNLFELENKNQLITNSIEYARKIQEAFLPSISEFKEIFPNSFVFFKPRDVVSGDFFWAHSEGDMQFVAVVDCTGHGVPGAFMSIIGNTLLNEIVREKKIYQPSHILNMLNQGIISALHQDKGSNYSQDDGMDIAFCSYSKSSKKIVLATTSHMAIVCDDTEVQKINCDLFSIGGSFSTRENVVFNETEISVNNSTQLFLYSDGFQDQFGGPNNTKLMTEPFEEFLISINKQNIDEQITAVENKFAAWKGNNKQIDDVLVIGLKFSDI
ncbi:MAG: SpoIIE family protein phosphatase [Bacteroidia bacterium]|nr:SpoIIE family protein phosphatase [Bacteroidia bacterium]